jgi:hypothetical protein
MGRQSVVSHGLKETGLSIGVVGLLSAAPAALGMVVFFGYLRTATGSFSLTLTVAGVSLILSSLIALPLCPRR